MPLLIGFISFIVVLALWYGLKWLFLFRKKEKFEPKSFFLPSLIDGAIGFGCSLVLGLILLLASGGISWLSGTLCFGTITLLALCFKPTRIAAFIKKQNKPNRKKIAFVSVLAVGLLVDVFAINARAFKNVGVQSEVVTTSFVSTTGQKNADSITLSNNNFFIVESPEATPTNVRFNFKHAENCYVKVRVDYTYDGDKYFEGESYDMDANNEDFHLVSLPTDHVMRYRFHVNTDNHYGQTNTVDIVSVTFNVKPRVNFSAVRYLVFAGIAGLCFYSTNMLSFLKKRKEATKLPYLLIGGFALAAGIAATIAILVQKDAFLTPYPISQEQLAKPQTDIFVALFDAFRKGQPHLDITPDPKLLTMENPYDPAARSAIGVNYLWDHAYYNGKYYSYYGALPVLLVSFPLYLLSGGAYVPNAFCLEVIGMCFLIPAFLLLLLEIYRFVCKQISWPGYVLLGFVGAITSMMISAITFKDGYYHEGIYHVPDIYGLLFFDLFLFFVLRAYRKAEKGRLVELIFSGLCFVAVIAARPNLVLGVLIAVPFYLSMLIRKEYTWKKKLIQFGSLFGVLAIGAVLICVYNKVRFDSIFEFGQSYQLNVTDQRTLTYAPNKFYPSFLHFYFQGPSYYDRFPFISCSIIRFNFDDCPYISSYFGTMLVPMFAVTWALPFLFWKGEKVETRAFSIIFPLLCVLFAFTTYSKAGICPRYLIEQYHLMTIAFFFLMLKAAKKTQDTVAYKPVVIVGSTIVLFSVFECLCLSFDIFDGMNTGDLNGFFLICKQIFQSFNF